MNPAKEDGKKIVRHGAVEHKEFEKSDSEVAEFVDKVSSRGSSKKLSSRIVKRPDKTGYDDEISVQITVPKDGGWGWVVVTSSFFTLAILNAVQLTFGALLHDIANDLKISKSMTSLINSIAIAVSFSGGPVASALINRYGFRACAMFGSILTSFSLFICFFLFHYYLLCIFYGLAAGFGNCLMHMTAQLVVGFYFEKHRYMAMSIATSGSSLGVVIMGPINAIIVDKCGWRVVTILEAGLVGIIYFLSMTYLPLLSFSIGPVADDDDNTLVTQLPSLSSIKGPMRTKSTATLIERRFHTLSNINFPTALDVLDEVESPPDLTPRPSTSVMSKMILIPRNPYGEISQKQMHHIKAVMSRTNVTGRKNSLTIKEILSQPPPKKKKRRCCGILSSWEKDIPESRPMYRDDAFYRGSVYRLPAYKKSRANIPETELTGLEYQMAVSRTALAQDFKEKKVKIFSTAVKRVLVTMMDPSLLKRPSFILMNCSGTIVYLGFLIPYIYIQDRTLSEGISPAHANFFVSTISVANLVGRLIIGFIVTKLDSLMIYTIFLFICGISVIALNFSFNLYYQHVISFMFGFFNSGISSLKSIVLVDLYGLEKLTNATGINLLFCGAGTLLGPPLASYLKNIWNYSVSFYFAGVVIIISAIMLIPVKKLSDKEKRKESLLGFEWTNEKV